MSDRDEALLAEIEDRRGDQAFMARLRERLEVDGPILDRLTIKDSVMLVEAGWADSTFIKHPGGRTFRILHYPDGTMRFEHECKVVDGTLIICAPALQLDNGGHRVTSRDPLTIEPSILCPDCGTHGFIRNNYWTEA